MKEVFDQFADVIDKSSGIFEGGALGEFDAVTTGSDSGGYSVQMNCRVCGEMRKITIDWSEMMAIQVGVSPSEVTEWGPGQPVWRQVQGGFWVPDGLRCKCGAPIRPMISMQEARSSLDKAVSMNKLSSADAEQLEMAAMMARKRRR